MDCLALSGLVRRHDTLPRAAATQIALPWADMLGPFRAVATQAKRTCGPCRETGSEFAGAGNDGKGTSSFGIFRCVVGRPEGAETDQPGAERSAAPGGDDLFAAMIRYSSDLLTWFNNC